MRLALINPLSGFLLTAILIAGANVCEAKKIIKWVDSNGVTHYGDQPPSAGNAGKSTELNKHGVKMKETDNRKKPKESVVAQPKISEEQKRHDNALLSTFYSVEEIEMARKRNTENDVRELELLQEKKRKLKAEIAEHNQSNSTAISALQNLDLRIKIKEKTIAATNERYKKDKIRFLELKLNQ